MCEGFELKREEAYYEDKRASPHHPSRDRRLLVYALFLSLLSLAVLLPSGGAAEGLQPQTTPPPRTLRFAGYSWFVKTGAHDPGSNDWSARNAYVDSRGLHLKITRVNGTWYCGEVWLDHALGYGVYTFQVASGVAGLDRNAVAGLFLYRDDSHELDVEFSRWANASRPNAQYAVTPYGPRQVDTFNITEHQVTATILWMPFLVAFETNTSSTAHSWLAVSRFIPPTDALVHMNLWLYTPALDNATAAELTVSNFTYQPLVKFPLASTPNQAGAAPPQANANTPATTHEPNRTDETENAVTTNRRGS